MGSRALKQMSSQGTQVMVLSVQQVLMAIGLASTVTTAVFWGAFLLGRLMNRIEWVERRVGVHDEHLFGRRVGDQVKVQL